MIDDGRRYMAEDGEEPCFEELTEEERMDYVTSRIEAKLLDYDGYDFTLRQSRALNIFFELSQELRGREMFYTVCMVIPRILLRLESSIYILEDEETFSLAGCSLGRCEMEPTRTWDHELTDHIVLSGQRLFIPICANPEYIDMLPFAPPHNIIGSFVMSPCDKLAGHAQLFLEKYVNRIGFQLHHRIIRARNREHISFIKSMVQDIGHNVIVPNMYFKLYFNQLKRQIEELHLTTAKVLDMMNDCGRQDCVGEGNRLASIAAGIEAQYQEIYSHYESTSMFLETLLRRRHFEEGRYVLDKREVNLRKTVIEPVVERFRLRFEDLGIKLDLSLGGPPDQMIRLVIDRGLILQVVDNLFNNALKYTGNADLPDGRSGKFVAYGWEVLKDHFAPGLPGIRIWVASTGKPLELGDPMEVFKPGFRAGNVARQPGTGRGLYFVRQVVELHDGQVGYAYTARGNEFSMILPFEQEKR
ncbi:sensor histidine kinase [Pseudodesulfovibrio portus]|uniref:histidine kinase n=1 Tax=Pseudodesulfovibrio portus TaxID=231439 RepID=A0ABM8ARI6_9BACT|nr:HAMP domain-containing sensor histidine kinase [Pseudodesulfovibrio portus]BDQ33901.1 sensor histidine kinase [Pseudodesulfovibrio portus]